MNMFSNVNNAKEYFQEYSNTVDASGCPLCKRHFKLKGYVPQHILLHCPIADSTPLSPQLLSQLYYETTNSINRSRSGRPPCTEWNSFSKFLSYSNNPEEGIIYEIEFENGSVSRVRNVSLLRSRSGVSLSKQGYRLRKKGRLPNKEFPTGSSPIASLPQPPIPSVDLIGVPSLPPPTPQIPISKPPKVAPIPAPLFPSIPLIPSVYPGSTNPRSIDYLLSRISLSSSRIKSIKSTISKWCSHISGGGIKSAGALVAQADSFALLILKENCSVSHKRNSLQNMLVFLRTLITYDNAEYVIAKAQAACKFIGIELRKLNIAINKIRAQSSSMENQRLSGKWISAEKIKEISKKALHFVDLLLHKFWTHSGRFPSLNRSTRTLFTSLSLADARFFQACLLWRMFSYWTPQRSGRIESLFYEKNLKWDHEKRTYFFIESIDSQKSAFNRETSLSTLEFPSDLSHALDFNLFFVIPKITNGTLSSTPKPSSVFLTQKGTSCTQESINNLLTRLARSIDPSASPLTCQLLRKLSQSFFFAEHPSLEEIESYNHLSNHSLTTSLLYYKLFINNPSTAMINPPSIVTTIWS